MDLTREAVQIPSRDLFKGKLKNSLDIPKFYIIILLSHIVIVTPPNFIIMPADWNLFDSLLLLLLQIL